jgi:hypothetical protein
MDAILERELPSLSTGCGAPVWQSHPAVLGAPQARPG